MNDYPPDRMQEILDCQSTREELEEQLAEAQMRYCEDCTAIINGNDARHYCGDCWDELQAKLVARHGDLTKPNGIELIAEERDRQLSDKGFSPDHDDLHIRGELSSAAIAYILFAGGVVTGEQYWLWSKATWKPVEHNPIRNLIKAGALIAAEIDRLQRVIDRHERGTTT